LVSEVVSTSVLHGDTELGAGIVLHAAVASGCIRVEVADAGGGFRPAETPMPRPDGQGGWGLFIVNSAASRWGVSTAEGSCVWFELDRDEGARW
jgi:anti-sigma regulatory factor (Ser/Thr protein kinase)